MLFNKSYENEALLTKLGFSSGFQFGIDDKKNISCEKWRE